MPSAIEYVIISFQYQNSFTLSTFFSRSLTEWMNRGVICCPCWRFCRHSVHPKSLSQSKSKGYEKILFYVKRKINVCTCLCFAKGDEWVKVDGDSSTEMLYEGHVWTMVGSLLSRTYMCAVRICSQENSLLCEYRARTYKNKIFVVCFHKLFSSTVQNMFLYKSHNLVRLHVCCHCVTGWWDPNNNSCCNFKINL